MTFDEIFDQIITLLKTQGRVSYGAIKRRFDLDDDYLDDLKTEIIEAQQLAVDENGRIMVWVADTASTQGQYQAEPTQTQQPTIQADRAPQTEPPPEPPTPDAERRQLTVMFCDLADSTKLSGQLDPEELRDVIRAYQATCAEVIERYDGYIAQHLGDGLMVYFGWPQAHEDDARRAVHAGLGILEAMQGLNPRLKHEKGIRLAVRIGIHTGLVVVGEIGYGASQEHLALGETPNVASRIEGVAEPDTAAISEATYQLVQGYFVCDDLGQHNLKGVNEPQQVYQVVRESDTRSRLDIAMTGGLTPLVGRESEVILLFERWQQVKEGQGQVILLSGEAGIGKSRLLQVMKGHVAGEDHVLLECRSSPYYQNTALYPITDMLQRLLVWQQGDTPEAKLENLEQYLRQYRLPMEETVPLFAPVLFLSIPEDRYPPLALSPQRQRQKMLETLVAMLLEQAEQKPVLFILEDLHWTDPSTLDLLDMLIDQAPTASLLILLTCRPEFEPPWGLRTHLTPIALNRFTRVQIEAMVERVTGGKTVPAEVMQHLIEKTDGVPLYVEEMTKAILESDAMTESAGQYTLTGPLAALSIPATLQDSLMARLDRLVTAKPVAQYAAVIGRQFSYTLLQAVSRLDEAMLQHELRRLVEAELLYQRGLPPQVTYIFKHALVRDAAYLSLLRSKQKQHHERIATLLQERFLTEAGVQFELVAHHYTEAGLVEEAIPCWQEAGQQAASRHANMEAVHHFRKGLELLKTVPHNQSHDACELNLQIALGAVLQSKGAGISDVGTAYKRAHELCRTLGDTPHLFPTLYGLWKFSVFRAELETASDLVKQMSQLAARDNRPEWHVMTYYAAQFTALSLGELRVARTEQERGLAQYNSTPYDTALYHAGQDPGVAFHVYLGLTLWLLGYADQAATRCREGISLARELGHPFSLAFSFDISVVVFHARREVSVVQAMAEENIELSDRHGFGQWLDAAKIWQGWVHVMQEPLGSGLEQMRESNDAVRNKGGETFQAHSQAVLAGSYLENSQPENGLEAVTEALAHISRSGECWWEAEVHRLRGELYHVLDTDRTEVERCFQKALDIARRHQAKSLELRAATSLARLWQSQGKRQEAYDLLAPVYGWFTEGFDTADLKDAEALLQELDG